MSSDVLSKSQILPSQLSCDLQLEERDLQEKADAERCQQRLQHLKTLGQQPKEQVLDWNRQRLPRILADHLLRSGYTETANVLTESADLQVSLHNASTQPLLEASASESSQFNSGLNR